ncbi:MAG: hypothetical protein LUC91_01580 [Prevotella sp.]|nr:hypothetical protein [Prevotella sp.]
MTGPQFSKPTLHNILCNVPFTVSLIVLIILPTFDTQYEKIPILLTLPIFVVSAFVSNTYDVLRSKKTILTVPVSLLVSSFLLYRYIHHTDTATQLSFGGGNVLGWILCGILLLLTAFIFTFLLNWMLTRDDDSQSELFERILNSKVLRVVVVCCVVVSVIIFSVSIFNPYFTYDESFTLHLVSLGFVDGIDITAHDVHPPLYYIMLKVWLSFLSFGSNDIYVRTVLSRLLSFVAYVLTGLMCWRKIHRGGEYYVHWLLLLFFCAFSVIFRYGVEIRMYSWALFFVTATFLYARDAIHGINGWKTWIIIIFFSVCSAYTHNFALISVSVIWIILLVWFCLRDRRMLLRWSVCAVIFAIVYLPWMIVLLRQMQHISSNYWISFSTGEFLYIFYCLLFPMHIFLPFLFVKALRTRDDRKISFDDIMGMIVPIATLVIGVSVSLLFRPIIVARYLVPSLFCMCISLLFIFQHARSKEKFLFVSMLLFAFFVSSYNKVNNLVSDCRNMKAICHFFYGIDTDVVFIFPTYTGTKEAVVFSSMTKNDIVTLNAYYTPLLGKQKKALMYPNIKNFDNKEVMLKYIRSCKKLYYVTYSNLEEEADSLIPPDYTIDYVVDCIGDYNKKKICHIYKLIPRN